MVQLHTHMNRHTPTQQPSVEHGDASASDTGEILTAVFNACLHWGGRVHLSDGNSKWVLLPLRMRAEGSGWVLMFVLALAFSTYPALGILKKTCPVPSSVHCPIVFHFPHWWKWKRNQHKHSIVHYEICTGNWKCSQNRPGCVMARGCGVGRELQEPFRLQRCVPHFRWGAEATDLWVFSIILDSGSWSDLLSMHWQRLQASVGAARLPELRHRPCQVSVGNTTRTKRKQASTIYLLL